MYICMRVFVSACAQSFCQRRSQLDASVTVDMSQDIRAGHFSSPALPPALNTSIFLSDPSPIIVYPCHSLTHSLTNSLTNCCLVNLIDVTLLSEDANSKLVEVVIVADVDA